MQLYLPAICAGFTITSWAEIYSMQRISLSSLSSSLPLFCAAVRKSGDINQVTTYARFMNTHGQSYKLYLRVMTFQLSPNKTYLCLTVAVRETGHRLMVHVSHHECQRHPFWL